MSGSSCSPWASARSGCVGLACAWNSKYGGLSCTCTGIGFHPHRRVGLLRSRVCRPLRACTCRAVGLSHCIIGKLLGMPTCRLPAVFPKRWPPAARGCLESVYSTSTCTGIASLHQCIIRKASSECHHGCTLFTRWDKYLYIVICPSVSIIGSTPKEGAPIYENPGPPGLACPMVLLRPISCPVKRCVLSRCVSGFYPGVHLCHMIC